MPDRIKQEIEDLLARLDTFPPPRPWYKRAWDGVAGFFGGIWDAIASFRLPGLSAGHVLLIAIGVIVVLYLAGPGGDVVRWIIAAAVVVFIGAFFMSLRRHSRPSQKYWRDKPIDFDRRSRRSPRDRDRR